MGFKSINPFFLLATLSTLPIVVKFLVLSNDRWMLIVVRVTKGFAHDTRIWSPILVTDILGKVSWANNFCENKRRRKKIKIFCMILEEDVSELQVLQSKDKWLLMEIKNSICPWVKKDYPVDLPYEYKEFCFPMQNNFYWWGLKHQTSSYLYK